MIINLAKLIKYHVFSFYQKKMDNTRQRKWTQSNTELLCQIVNNHGKNWAIVSNYFNISMQTLYPKNDLKGRMRDQKQCRERYLNFHDIITSKLTLSEKEAIDNLRLVHGNRWTKMAELMPGRSANQLKNYWHSRSKSTNHKKINHRVDILKPHRQRQKRQILTKVTPHPNYSINALALVATSELYRISDI